MFGMSLVSEEFLRFQVFADHGIVLLVFIETAVGPF
jgi:hypothetical protein